MNEWMDGWMKLKKGLVWANYNMTAGPGDTEGETGTGTE